MHTLVWKINLWDSACLGEYPYIINSKSFQQCLYTAIISYLHNYLLTKFNIKHRFGSSIIWVSCHLVLLVSGSYFIIRFLQYLLGPELIRYMTTTSKISVAYVVMCS